MYVLYFLQTEEQWDVTIFRKISYQFKQDRCVDVNNILELILHGHVYHLGIKVPKKSRNINAHYSEEKKHFVLLMIAGSLYMLLLLTMWATTHKA